MSAANLGKKTLTGILWSSLEKMGGMALQFGVNIVMTRLLLPEAFGTVGMLEIFIAVSQTLVEGGFASALIQKKDPSSTDYSSVFFCNLAISLLLYAILFFSAPFIAAFYRMPMLCGLLRVLALIIVTSALSIVQVNILKKKLSFRHIAFVNILSYALSAAAAITAAVSGLGAWAIVILMLGNSAVSTIIFWISARWRPSPVCSIKAIKDLFSFGGYFLGANILQEIAKNLQSIIIGRRFSATDMGLFTQAYKLDRISSYTLPSIIVQVLFPVYSSIQDDDDRFAETLRSSVRLVAFIIFPLMAALIMCASPLIRFLYTDTWLPAVPYFRILCVGGFFVCLQNVNFYAVAAQGKSRALFLWSFYKWSFLIVALVIAMFFGMKMILWAMTLSGFNIYLVNAALAGRFSRYSLISQIKDISLIALNTLAPLALAWWLSSLLSISTILSLPLFLALYLLLAFVFHSKPLSDCISIINRFRAKNATPGKS
ncbi:MAG: lipopolysaccharide biosynthesis protein [Bacteroidales bacterium]|nr:lipopolysaccharide biosynthesis protein [Bacteroidales bacterium]